MKILCGVIFIVILALIGFGIFLKVTVDDAVEGATKTAGTVVTDTTTAADKSLDKQSQDKKQQP